MRSGVRISPGAPYEMKKPPLAGGFFVSCARKMQLPTREFDKTHGAILDSGSWRERAPIYGWNSAQWLLEHFKSTQRVAFSLSPLRSPGLLDFVGRATADADPALALEQTRAVGISEYLMESSEAVMRPRKYLSVLLMLLLGIASPVLVVAGEGAPSKEDAATTQRVEAALRARNLLNTHQIQVETREGVVQLSGFVESEDMQEQALETARTVEGVASVRNDLVVPEKKPTLGAALDDTIIAAKVREELKDNAANSAGDIQVEVSSGVVQLSGFVPTVEAKTRAADVASTVEGVRDVRNDIALEK